VLGHHHNHVQTTTSSLPGRKLGRLADGARERRWRAKAGGRRTAGRRGRAAGRCVRVRGRRLACPVTIKITVQTTKSSLPGGTRWTLLLLLLLLLWLPEHGQDIEQVDEVERPGECVRTTDTWSVACAGAPIGVPGHHHITVQTTSAVCQAGRLGRLADGARRKRGGGAALNGGRLRASRRGWVAEDRTGSKRRGAVCWKVPGVGTPDKRLPAQVRVALGRAARRGASGQEAPVGARTCLRDNEQTARSGLLEVARAAGHTQTAGGPGLPCSRHPVS
jgi:hypothetical protein